MPTTGSRADAQLLHRLTPVSPAPLLGVAEARWPERILVCANESESTSAALAMTKALAVRSGAEVEVLSVFAPPIPLPDVPGRTGPARCEERDRWAATELIHAVRTLERRQFDGHVAWPVHLEVGDPVKTIIETAKRVEPDLLVLGLERGDAAPRMPGRALAASICRYTDVPLLVAAPLSTALPQTAVLFVDRENPEIGMVRAALRSVEDAAFVWVLIHAGTTPHSVDGVRREKGTMSRIVGAIREEAAAVSKKIVVRAIYQAGDPVQAILATACEVNADLVVTPLHGTPGFVRSLVQNVADPLLLVSPCSVLVVPDA